MTQLDSAIEMLRKEFGGSIVAPADAGYDEHRAVWNAMIDKRPAVHRAVHRTPADVVAAVQLRPRARHPRRGPRRRPQRRGQGHVRRRDRDRPLADERGRGRHRPQDGARAGRHDVGRLRRRDPGGRSRDAGRCHLDHGHRRPHARRRLRVADPPVRALVRQPAVGRPRHRRRASSSCAARTRTPSCSGRLRGGGGNFGVATSFEYRLHPVGPLVLGGLIGWPLDQAADVLAFHREQTRNAPRRARDLGRVRHRAAAAVRAGGAAVHSPRSS